MNVIVFDIGGTLMEYVNMPNVWIDYYDSAFRHVREKLGLPLTDEQLEASIEVLKRYNPRVKYSATLRRGGISRIRWRRS